MSEVINQRHARVRRALTRRSASDLDRLPALWQQLVDSLPLQAGLERSNWLAVASSDVIHNIIDLFDLTANCDLNGMASSYAARCVTTCASLADDAALLMNEKQRDEAWAFSNKVVERIPSIIQRWWGRLRPLTSKWIWEGTLTRNIGMFIILFDSCGDHRRPTPQVSTSLEQIVASSTVLHDFLLFATIFFSKCDGDFETPLLFALSIATRASQPSSLANLPTIREQLKVYPLALSLRLKEMLRDSRLSPNQAFHVVVRTMSWLADDDLYTECMAQGDLAFQLASSYWTYCVSSSRSLEVDQDTETTLVLLGQLSDLIPSNSSKSRRAQFVGYLLVEHDLLSLVEKVMVIHTRVLSQEPQDNWPHISRLLLYNQEALRPPLRRDFLLMFDYLRTVETPMGRRLLDLWTRLGSTVGVHEQELRAALDCERKAEQGGLIGCSWLKCALYEQECAKNTFLCARCRKAMYCGLSCQDRDWREGGHAAKCKIPSGVF